MMSVKSTGLTIGLAALLASCVNEPATTPPSETPAEAPAETPPAPPAEPASAGTFDDYLAALAQRESSNNPYAENTLGYLGLYQTGEIALIDVNWYDENDAIATNRNDWIGDWLTRAQSEGAHSKASYLGNVPAQDAAIRRYYDKVWTYIHYYHLDDYDGQTVDGVLITPSGLLAGWHLLGGGLKTYLQSNGADAPSDAYGTTIREYISTFGGYDTPYTD